jgi:antitoxin VapB
MQITIDDNRLNEDILRAAMVTGQTVEQLVLSAVREKLANYPRPSEPLTEAEKKEMLAKVQEIQAHVANLPVLDNRSADEIIGYNERGHFD